MNCMPTRVWRPSRFSAVVITFFVLFIALQAAYSEEVAPPVEPAKVTTAPGGARISTRPFSHIALGVTAGSLGVGVEAATPLSRRTNLRVDGHFFNYSQTLTQDGVSYNGNLRLRDARASYDFYPFGGGFRLSGGVALYNQFNVKALASVPAGQTITFNNVDYYSSAADPLKGTATIGYANQVAPTFTFGWGNAIPRSGRRLAFPVEIGAAYTGTPAFNLAMTGSACSPTPATCGVVTTFDGFQSNLNIERNKITNDIRPLRFYPIINAGVTYRF